MYCAGANDISGQPYLDNVIEVFDTAGASLNTIHIRKPGETGLIDIRDLDIDNSGRIYAVDIESSKVRLLDEESGYITSFGIKGIGGSNFNTIHGIAISPTGTIAITDHGTIHLFTSALK